MDTLYLVYRHSKITRESSSHMSPVRGMTTSGWYSVRRGTDVYRIRPAVPQVLGFTPSFNLLPKRTKGTLIYKSCPLVESCYAVDSQNCKPISNC